MTLIYKFIIRICKRYFVENFSTYKTVFQIFITIENEIFIIISKSKMRIKQLLQNYKKNFNSNMLIFIILYWNKN
ncbi:hypothetical protein pb186bvf_002690 [Paramecium bursaria]